MSRSLEYMIKTDMYPSSSKITYEVDPETINYVVPVCAGSTYTITMNEIGNRLRAVFTTVNPMTITSSISGCTDIVMNPTFSVGYTFSYKATKYGYIVIYVSNVGEHPNIEIKTDGAGGDDEYSVFCTEINSGTDLSCEIYTKANDWILATVSTRSDTTFSDGWEVLHESGQIGDVAQRMFFLSKQSTEDGLITINVTQSSAARIYINLIAIPNILGFRYNKGYDLLEGTTEIMSAVLKRPIYPFIIWGCSANLWDTSSTHSVWSCDNLTPISLGTTVQGRQANFIDKNITTQRTFATGATTYMIIDCVEAVQFVRKYLIRSDNTLYTVVEGTLTQIENTKITSDVFRVSGIDDVPTWEIIQSLTNPEILAWYDSDNVVPKLNAEVTATPFFQTIITDKIDMSHTTILGVEQITIDCDDDVLVAISLDNKETWIAYNGTQWITLTSDTSGMGKSVIEAISIDNWTEIIGDVKEMFIRLTLTNKEQFVRQIYVDFLN